MVDIFTGLLNSFLNPIVEAYGLMLAGFPLNFLSYIVSAILLALFMQVVFAIFPWLKDIVDALMFPFRIIHVWLHVHQANTVIKKQVEMNPEKKSSLQFITYFGTGFNQKVENAGLTLHGICSPKEAASIANAPLKGALVLLFVLCLLTPFLRISFLGTLVHLYIFIGIATASFPSANDYQYTRNMLLLNSTLDPLWTILPLIGFTIGFILSMNLTNNILYAIIWGISVASLCFWIIMMVGIKISDKEANSKSKNLKRKANTSTSDDSKNYNYSELSTASLAVYDTLNNLEYNF